MEDEITCSTASVETRESLLTEYYLCTRLCSCSYIERLLADYGYLDYPRDSESCLCRRECHTVVEVESLACQSTLAIRYFECDIEVSVSITATMSLITNLDTHSILDSFWDIDIFLDGFVEFSLSVTVFTLFDDLLACSVTGMTWTLLLHHTEYRLHALTYLTTSMTGCTCLSSSTSTITVMTVNFSVERYLAT